MSDPKFSLEMGDKYPYEIEDDIPSPARDWAHRAVRGILADLTDRKGVRHELENVDYDVRAELVDSLSDIVRAAYNDAKSSE